MPQPLEYLKLLFKRVQLNDNQKLSQYYFSPVYILQTLNQLQIKIKLNKESKISMKVQSTIRLITLLMIISLSVFCSSFNFQHNYLQFDPTVIQEPNNENINLNLKQSQVQEDSKNLDDQPRFNFKELVADLVLSSGVNEFEDIQLQEEKIKIFYAEPPKQRIRLLQAISLQNDPSSPQNQLNSSQAKLLARISDQPEQEKKKPQIINRQFMGIGLYHDVPINFIDGQVFRFHGIVTDLSQVIRNQIKVYYINIIISQYKGSNQIRCTQELDKNFQFEVSCKVNKPGRYFVSIFGGMSGRSSFRLRNIIPNSNLFYTYSLFQGPKPQGIRLDVIDNNLYVIWSSKANITNLTVYQKDSNDKVRKNQYLLSNNHERFRVPIKDFNQFQQKTTYVQISHAQSLDGFFYSINTKFSSQLASLNFTAGQYAFDQNVKQAYQTSSIIPWKLNIGQKIIINATFKQDLREQLIVIEPDLNLKSLPLIQDKKFPVNTIKAGTPLSIQISFTKPGTHIIQINAVSGMAIINQPIYIGNIYPLIPDYRALAPYTYGPDKQREVISIYQKYFEKMTSKLNITQPGKDSAIDQKRNYLLVLLNGLRQKYKVAPVAFDDKLNQIAQGHSDDMAKNNYFSHTDLKGDGPGQRARKANFTSSIGENIAQSNFLIQSHLGLERSAAHLENSINPMWRRVGIGISSFNNQYIVAFEFSTRDLKKFPLTPQQQQKYQAQLVKFIKQRNPNIVRENRKLSQAINSWLQSDRNNGIFQYISKTGAYNGPMAASSFRVSYSQDWIQNIRNSNILRGSPYDKFKEIGAALSLKNSQTGLMESYIVFT